MSVIKSPVETQLYPALLARMVQHLERYAPSRGKHDDDYNAAIALSSTDKPFDPKAAARAIDSIVTEAAECPEPLHCLEEIVDGYRRQCERHQEYMVQSEDRMRVYTRLAMIVATVCLVTGIFIGRLAS